MKHEFGKINQQEWKETLDFMDFLGEKTNKAKIILIKGNHDTILGPLAERRGMEIKDYYIKSGFGFLHGNKQFPEVLDKEIKTLFVGHFHPAITLSEGVKKEKYKCFLEGKWGSKQIVILPSFFPFVEGADVEIDKTNLDFKFNLKKFKVFIPVKGREVLEFGTVKKGGKLNL